MQSTIYLRLRFKANRLWGYARLRLSGVQAGKSLTVVGAPEISIYPGSRIFIGDCVTLISSNFATALGINHPVVLRTLRPDAEIHLHRNVGISGGSICAARRVEIGEETRLGANVTIADTDFHSLHPTRRGGHLDPTIGVAEVKIGRRVLIGTNSIILKGVCIGENSVIGAGSVVTRSLPANCVAAGNPCKILRFLTEEELAP